MPIPPDRWPGLPCRAARPSRSSWCHPRAAGGSNDGSWHRPTRCAGCRDQSRPVPGSIGRAQQVWGRRAFNDIIIRRLMPRPCLPAIAVALALSAAHAHGAESPAESPELLPRCPDDDAARRIAADPVLRPPQGQENDQWQGEWGTLNLDRERRLTLGGGGVLRRGGRELATDTLTMRDEGRRVEVEGGLTYRDPELIVSGESGIVEGEEASF